MSISSTEKSSLKVNADGTIDVYFGPKAPEGLASNWIPTGDDFFLWFRLHGPEKALFDKSWKLPDIEKVFRRRARRRDQLLMADNLGDITWTLRDVTPRNRALQAEIHASQEWCPAWVGSEGVERGIHSSRCEDAKAKVTGPL